MFGQQRRQMKGGTDSDHQFDSLRDCGQRRSRRPSIQRIRFHTFDVVEVQFGDQRQVEADLFAARSEEHTSELQSQSNLVCRLLLEKKKQLYSHCMLVAIVQNAYCRVADQYASIEVGALM